MKWELIFQFGRKPRVLRSYVFQDTKVQSLSSRLRPPVAEILDLRESPALTSSQILKNWQ
jgi:hypothetical protein